MTRIRTLLYMTLAALGLSLSSCGSDDKPAQGNGYPNGIKSEKAMKKVIILSSSPRKGGNSDLLCDRFMEGALSARHQVEKLFLYDYEINDFIANDSLADHTDRNAADDVPMIMDKLVAADVIVLATPVYYYTMCGRMKTMIDRTYSRHRELKGKEFYYIITAAVRDKNRLQRTVEEFRGFLDCLPSPQECGIIYGMGTHNKGSVMGMPVMQEAYDMGKEI